ncbi:hypothetical protein NC796_00465 [Aliifodinibius sp. S!AR15-10]|uniref:hypothetical protein n=1 Tax=Aliifodinibius sp. S!AR15-10 TaxID=2950437 RepID=UPI00285D2E67|nr:hypothetical protein [Aliifodinibius sp. S!AR15-10]MDR8389586.1 hypothetical protein [Aliifodinibius sp. S!AR15-10]
MELITSKVTELHTSDLRKINGGSVTRDIGYILGYAAGVIVKSVRGAYQQGYDSACGC